MTFAFNAVAHYITPFVTVYGQENGVSSTISNPDILPTGSGLGADWSPGAEYLAVGHISSPFISVYKRAGQELTKIADPATLPTGDAKGVSWSPDGVYLAVSHSTSPYVSIYKRSGDVLTKLPNPAVLPTGSGWRTPAWTSDGVYLSIAHTTSPYVTVYKRAGDVFTKIANPDVLPTGTGYSVAWSEDTTYMSVGHANSPFASIYKRAGDVLTKLANPAVLPYTQGAGVSFSPDNTYLSVTNTSTVRPLDVYKRAGDVFTRLASGVPSSNVGAVASSWTSDSAYLSVSMVSTPYILVYSRSGDVFTTLAAPADLPPGNGLDTAYSESVPAPLPWPPQPDYYNAVAVDAYQGSTALSVYGQKGTEFDRVTAPSPYYPGTCVGWGGNTYLVVGQEGLYSGPYFYIYKRTGTTFTLLTQLQGGQGPRSISWSADSLYLNIAARDGSTFVSDIYKRNADAFVKLAGPPGTRYGWDTCLSSDATYFVEPTGSSYSVIQKRSGNTFTYLTNTPSISNTAQRIALFSNDDTYLAVGGGSSPQLAFYKRSGDTFTALPNMSPAFPSQPLSLAWSPDDTYLAGGHGTTGRVAVYKRSGDTFTRLTVPSATGYSSDGSGVAWSPDGRFLTVTLSNLNVGPWVVVYERSGDVFTKLTTPTGLPTMNTMGTSYSSFLNVPPTAPTLVAPADLAEVPAADPLLYDWVFNDADPGDTQSEFALVRRKVAR